MDEKSLAAIGQWPWRRDIVATLLDAPARDWAPPTIGVDVIFPESDRDDDERDAPDAVLADTLRAGPRGARLRDAVRRRGAAGQALRARIRWGWPW